MSKKEKFVEKCGAHLPDVNGGPDYVCELEAHTKYKKHRVGGVSWTDGGAERIQKELAAKKAADAVV